jgi:PEGA domain
MTLGRGDVTSDPEQDPLLLFATEHTLLADQSIDDDWFSQSTPEDDTAWSVATHRNGAVKAGRIAALCRRETIKGWALAATTVIARRMTGDQVDGVLPLNESNLTKFALPFVCGVAVGGLAVLFLTSGLDGHASTLTSQPVAMTARVPIAESSQLAPSIGRPAAEHVAKAVDSFPSISAEASTPAQEPQGTSGTAGDEVAVVFRGSLRVDSRPRGAQVSVNGRVVGTTPLDLSRLPVGSRAVRLELDGYQQWSSAVQVVANQRARVMAELNLTAYQ